MANGLLHSAILKNFQEKSMSEVHTALLAPVDVDVSFSVTINSKSGLIHPKVSIDIPRLRLGVDAMQLRALRDLCLLVALENKRRKSVLRCKGIFTFAEVPRLWETGGMRVLPAVMSGHWRYPVQTIPVTRTSLIGSLKKRIQRSQEGVAGWGGW